MFDMHKEIKLATGDNKLACVGDAHFGHPNHVPKMFQQAMDKIDAANQNVIFMGDMIECREPSHPLYTPGSVTINDQLNWYLDLCDHFHDKGKLVGVLIGNHEHGLIQKTSNNDIERYCRREGINYLDYMGVLDFGYEGYTYSVTFHHGAGAGSTIGGAANKLTNFTKYFANYDACIMAHTHQLAALPPNIHIYRDKKKHQNVDKYCFPAFTGSFFLTYKDGPSEYGERKAYSPLPIGYNVLTFEDGLAQSQSVVLRVKGKA